MIWLTVSFDKDHKYKCLFNKAHIVRTEENGEYTMIVLSGNNDQNIIYVTETQKEIEQLFNKL